MSDQPSRWSQATVHPDMWADPDDDPRDMDGSSPDGELATLQEYQKNYRLTLTLKCEGLNPEQLARRSVPPSTMSLLGLLRHLAEVVRDLMVHRIEEYARHCGHADLLRESINGRVGQ